MQPGASDFSRLTCASWQAVAWSSGTNLSRHGLELRNVLKSVSSRTNSMTDPVSGGLNLLKVSWDTPYRVAVSILSLGCIAVLMSAPGVTSPLGGVGFIGHFLGIPDADAALMSVSAWVRERGQILGPVAGCALLLGAIANDGDGTGRSLPSRWRGAPTALLGLVVLWEVSSDVVPAAVSWTLVTLGLLYVAKRWREGADDANDWRGQTILNFVTSVFYLPLLVIVWLLGMNEQSVAKQSSES